jgi:hypothetical protein
MMVSRIYPAPCGLRVLSLLADVALRLARERMLSLGLKVIIGDPGLVRKSSSILFTVTGIHVYRRPRWSS